MAVDLVIIIFKYRRDEGSFSYIGTSGEFHNFIDERSQNDNAEIFTADDSNQCQFLKLSKNNVSYYIFCGSHSKRQGKSYKFKGTATNGIVSSIKKIREHHENVPIKCFLHKDDFYLDEIRRLGADTYEFSADEFLEISSLSITDIVNWLMDKKNAKALYPKDFFFVEKVIENIAETLQPLHLALQAFFGISRNNNLAWKNLPDELSDEIKESYSVLFSEDNKQQAFLLVKEAEYDFFAEIGYRLGPRSNSTQNVPLEEQPLLSLIEKMFEDNKDMDNETFEDLNGNEINGKTIKHEIENLFDVKEGNQLRTLCAILSNINDDGINNTLLKDGKLSENEAATHIKRIKKGKVVSSNDKNCKVWLDKESHTKWPKDLNGSGNEKDDSYQNLVEQLKQWNKDGEPVKKVIHQIDTIIHYLDQIQTYLERRSRGS